MSYRLSGNSLRKLAEVLIHRYPGTQSSSVLATAASSPASNSVLFLPRLLTSSTIPLRTLAAGQPVSQRSGSSKFLEIKDEDDFIDSVMYSNDPVIVNFHADWCQPCQMLTPRLETAVESARNVRMCNVDIGAHPELVQEFEVQAVPAVVAVRRGRVVDKFVGLIDQVKIDKFVKRLDDGDGPSVPGAS
jgi:thioredoxin 1